MPIKNELLKDEAAIALGNILGQELKPISGYFETTRDVFYAFNLHYVNVKLALTVGDAAGVAIASPTVVLKTGEVAGSGDAVNAGTDGLYKVKKGTYNYSVSKTGYETETGTIVADYNDAIAEVKGSHITLKALSVVTLAVVDKDADAVAGSTVVVKTGAVIGSGTAVTAEANGTFKCSIGTYNYSISKTGYETETGTFAIVSANLDGTKTVTVTLKTPCVVTVAVTDEGEQAIAEPTIVIKKGATVGEGDAVNAEVDGTYKVGVGTFNYSVAKETYTTETGTFAIAAGDLDGTKTVAVVLAVDAE